MAKFITLSNLSTFKTKCNETYVPYTGATKDVNLGSHGLTTQTVITDTIYLNDRDNEGQKIEVSVNDSLSLTHNGYSKSYDFDFSNTYPVVSYGSYKYTFPRSSGTLATQGYVSSNAATIYKHKIVPSGVSNVVLLLFTTRNQSSAFTRGANINSAYMNMNIISAQLLLGNPSQGVLSTCPVSSIDTSTSSANMTFYFINSSGSITSVPINSSDVLTDEVTVA